MSVAPRRGSVVFVGGAGHSLKTSMYGKKSCFIIVSLEVLIHGAWSDLKESEDSELIEFTCRLLQTITHSWADSTVKKYLGAFRRWKIWASQHSMPILPAKDYQIVLYLRSLERSQSLQWKKPAM